MMAVVGKVLACLIVTENRLPDYCYSHHSVNVEGSQYIQR